MNWLHKLQRKFRFGIDNLMIYITATMLAVYLADMMLGLGLSNYLYFDRNAIFHGQIWRVISFVVIPPSTQPIFVLFSLYFYYFIGDSLERAWGADQFTFYYLCGIVGTIIAGLLTGSTSNYYLNMSLFFAFAQLFPETRVMLFFIIPVKVKWLANINWVLFGISLLQALISLQISTVAAILVSVVNFFLFFGPDMIDSIKAWKRRRDYRKRMGGDDNNFWR